MKKQMNKSDSTKSLIAKVFVFALRNPEKLDLENLLKIIEFINITPKDLAKSTPEESEAELNRLEKLMKNEGDE